MKNKTNNITTIKKLWLYDSLETKRCIIKIPEESDSEYIWNLINEETTKYMIWEKWNDFSNTLKNIKSARENANFWTSWDAAIYDKKTELCIWRCGINKIIDNIPSFELWYWIAPEYYGKWIMPECVKRFLKFAFEESSFEKWVIRCDTKNENSKKVALKCWFSHEGDFKNYERIRWELRDTSFYGITRTQYKEKTLQKS